MKTLCRLDVIRAVSGSALLLTAASGCLTVGHERQAREMQMREDQLVVQEDLRQLRGRMDDLEAELQRMDQEVRRATAEAEDSVRREVEPMGSRLADVERRVQEIDRGRESDKQEIIDTLSRKIAGMMQGSGGRATASTERVSRGGGETGYEHVVEPGQTLSEIATAYGVSVSVIVEANALKNPNQLRAGQRLFIPE